MNTPSIEEFARWHAEAVLAWATNPDVKLEYWTGTGWAPSPRSVPAFSLHPDTATWLLPRRIARPTERVPLDASDFVGPERVTHVKLTEDPGIVFLVLGRSTFAIRLMDKWVPYEMLIGSGAEISRDFGATWSPASKLKEGVS